MSPTVNSPQRKSGDFARAGIAPENLLAEPHFGLLDTVIVLVLLSFAGGLIYWFLG
jgi:hypothetical protein